MNKKIFVVFVAVLVVTMFTLPMSTAFAGEYPSGTSGMVSYWNFDEGSGTTAADSVNENDGSLEGAVSWVQGQVGNALTFNGYPDQFFVGNPDNLKLNESFTLEAWINNQDYAGSADYGHHVIVSHGAFGWMLMIEGNRVVGCWNYLTAHIVSSTELSLGTWYHVAWTKDASTDTEKIFVNGVEEAVYYGDIPYFFDPWFTNDYSYIYDFTIGNGPSGEFIGMIDEVAVYNRALTQEELSKHHQDGLLGKDYTTTLGTRKAGSIIPVKFQLKDAAGNYVSNAVTQIYVDGELGVSSGKSNTDNYFRYCPSSNQYIFNLSTKGLPIGIHTITAKYSNGETIAVWTITLK